MRRDLGTGVCGDVLKTAYKWMWSVALQRSRCCNLTNKFLALSVVENILISCRYATTLGTYNLVTYSGLAWRPAEVG